MSLSVRMLTAAIVAAAMIVGTASRSMASSVYDYVGNDFTFALAPYTTLDSISGSVTLSTPLGDNLNLQTVTPTAFSFSDGVQTLNQSNASSIFDFSTNASGQITQWVFALQGSFPLGSIQSEDLSAISGPVQDRAQNGPTGVAMNSSAGSWSSVPATPLPPALWFFATGLGLTGLFGRRSKRAAACGSSTNPA
jgi:hypothetical protein